MTIATLWSSVQFLKGDLILRFSSYFLVVATLGIGGILVTGCGKADPKVNTTKVEKILKEGISTQLGVDVAVYCPSNVKRKVGAKFTCYAQGPTTEKLQVRATQTAKNGNVKWKVAAGKTTAIQEQIAARILAERKITVTVACPEVVALKKGSHYTCTATDAATSEKRDIVVTETDNNGQVHWET